MKRLGEAKSMRDSESYHERLDAFPTIKIVILRRVNQIETGDPTDHSRGQNDRCKIDMSGLGDPRADRRQSQREPEEKVRSRGEALRYRIKKIAASATGESAKVSRLIAAAAATKPAEVTMSRIMAAGFEISRCREAVRGLR